MAPFNSTFLLAETTEVLNAYFGEKTPAFIAALKESQAIIAGGFALGIFMGSSYGHTSDIDMYVRYSSIKPILRFLNEHTGYVECHQVSPYCSSFMKRNGIVSRLCFRTKMTSEFVECEPEKRIDRAIDIDLMVLHEKTPVEVASNFDLTCCQVWFDGNKISGTHLPHTRNHKAFLNEQYFSSYLSGNKFTRGRVKKYLERGFKIAMQPIPNLGDYVAFNDEEPRKFLNVYDQMVASLLAKYIELFRDFFPLFALAYPEIFSKDLGKMVDVAFRFEEQLGKLGVAQNVASVILFEGLEFAIFLLTELNDPEYEDCKPNVLGPADADPEVSFESLLKTRKKVNGYLSKVFTDLGLYTIFRSHLKYQLRVDADQIHQENKLRDTNLFSAEEIKAMRFGYIWVDTREEPMTMEDAVAVAHMEYAAKLKTDPRKSHFTNPHNEFQRMAREMGVTVYFRNDTTVFKKALRAVSAE